MPVIAKGSMSVYLVCSTGCKANTHYSSTKIEEESFLFPSFSVKKALFLQIPLLYGR